MENTAEQAVEERKLEQRAVLQRLMGPRTGNNEEKPLFG